MRRFVMNDGSKYEADTDHKLIKLMMKEAWDTATTVPTYMRHVAARMRTQCNARISTRSANAFIKGLKRAGVLKEVTDESEGE